MNGLNYKKPALVGGALVAVLSNIPIVNLLNICLCLWAWVGGAVAAKMLIDRAPQPLTSREGARVGLLAGLLGAALSFVVQFPLTIFQMNRILETAAQLPIASEDARVLYERIAQSGSLRIALAFIFAFISALFLLGFTVLGGMVGVALFEKRKDPPPPAPYPPQYPPGYPQHPSTNYPPSSGGYGGHGGAGQGGQGGWPPASG
jgi:hypothetical protein